MRIPKLSNTKFEVERATAFIFLILSRSPYHIVHDVYVCPRIMQNGECFLLPSSGTPFSKLNSRLTAPPLHQYKMQDAGDSTKQKRKELSLYKPSCDHVLGHGTRFVGPTLLEPFSLSIADCARFWRRLSLSRAFLFSRYPGFCLLRAS